MLNQKGERKMDAKHIIEDHQYQNIPLNYDEAYELGGYAVDTYFGNLVGNIDDDELGVCFGIITGLFSRSTLAWKRSEKDQDSHSNNLPDDSTEQVAGIWHGIMMNITEWNSRVRNIIHGNRQN